MMKTDRFSRSKKLLSAALLDRLIRWQERQTYVEYCQQCVKDGKDLNWPQDWRDEAAADLVVAVKRRDRLHPPPPYRDWESLKLAMIATGQWGPFRTREAA